ncbi:hypothetical protein RB620_26070 [Paenibacillus sp. LHD-117]|uniref:hypothetical protein n=1 Tax=Paenibacillus sp. LHD-117 TaxID=3071412 RepID=UPI0027DF8E99|nr:hypothetical protein [Paenibacillus sp. LHD-117]MDQ6422899.1 hypothetical protein [Paenibacillus sp. LHD-117]
MSQLINPSFETGDFTGWVVTVPPGGTANVVSVFGSFTPIEGNFFALLKTDGPNSFTTIEQTFTAVAGQVISGYAFFQGNDSLPFNDFGEVQILQGITVVATPFFASVATGSTGWTLWSYTITTAGTYTVRARVTNALDSVADSFLGLDALQLSCPVANPQSCCQIVVDHLTQLVPPLALGFTPGPVQDVTVTATIEGVCPEKVIVCGLIKKTITYQGVVADPETGEFIVGTVVKEDQIPFQCAIDREDANAGDPFHVVPNGAAVLCSLSVGPQNTGVYEGFDVAWKWAEKDVVKVCIRKGFFPGPVLPQ